MSAGGNSADVLPIQFRIWGARGSRNATGSKIGNATSCYSLVVGAELFVFDAGSGLLALSAALQTDERLREVDRVHLLVSHAHWDHWEGLKDADWMWRKGNDLALTILGPKEAVDAIHRGFEPPSFISPEILALGTLASLSFVELAAGETTTLPGATLETVALHHYSGIAPHRRYLETLGFRLVVDGGPTVAYLCDHEPTGDTSEMERQLVSSADLAIIDASYGDIADHAFGHGSIESVARLARSFPAVRVLAAHHGPLRSDAEIEAAVARHAADVDGFALAVEGATEQWDPDRRRFTPL
jgi:phosphoribosyl 1,2-cyclic phosphodiesterase